MDKYQFIKPSLLSEDKKYYDKTKLVTGMTIHYDGRVWQLVKQDPLGWEMKVISGKDDSNTPDRLVLKKWDDPIYSQGLRFMPNPTEPKPSKMTSVKPSGPSGGTTSRPMPNKALTSDPRALYDRAIKMGTRLNPSEELMLSKDVDTAMAYAKNVLHGPFPELEDTLNAEVLEYPDQFLEYFTKIAKKRALRGAEMKLYRLPVMYRGVYTMRLGLSRYADKNRKEFVDNQDAKLPPILGLKEGVSDDSTEICFMEEDHYKYIKHREGHTNSEGEPAPWVIIQKGTGKILSSHKSKEEAIDSFQAMMANKHG